MQFGPINDVKEISVADPRELRECVPHSLTKEIKQKMALLYSCMKLLKLNKSPVLK